MRTSARLTHLACVWLCLMGLAGCQWFASGPDQPPREKAEPTEPAVDPAQARAERLEGLLERGDRALTRGRLMYPAGDNAHDHFARALRLDPDNSRARTGMQAIVLSYMDMARVAAAESDYARALQLMGRAESLAPDNALVAELTARIEGEREQRRQAREARSGGSLLVIDPEQLRRRDEALAEELGELARQVREEDGMILIVAGSDAAGRWIYQRMREGVPGYLLRGDIQQGSPPEVRRME